MKKALLIDSSDNVAVLTETACPGDDICYVKEGSEYHLTAMVEIPIYHKVAISPIKAGSAVIKYGQVIAIAFADIPVGSHVHNHNADSRDLIPGAGRKEA